MQWFHLALLGTGWALLSACGGNGDDGQTEEEQELEPATYAEAVAAMDANRNCGGPLCHTTTAGGNLLLTGAVDVYEQVVNQDASGDQCFDSGLLRVKPGEPDESLLYLKLSRDPPCGDPMPPAASLSDEQIDVIRRWIASGAPRE